MIKNRDDKIIHYGNLRQQSKAGIGKRKAVLARESRSCRAGVDAAKREAMPAREGRYAKGEPAPPNN